MPYRFTPLTTKIQFVTFVRMPYLIYQACLHTGTLSATRYIQEAVIARLNQDLDLDLDELRNELPPSRSRAACLSNPHERRVSHNQSGGVAFVGPANTNEEVE